MLQPATEHGEGIQNLTTASQAFESGDNTQKVPDSGLSGSSVIEEPNQITSATPASPVHERSSSDSSSCPSFQALSNAKSQTLSSSVHSDVQAESYLELMSLTVFFHLLGVLSLGVIYLAAFWRPDWRVRLCCTRTVLSKATHLIVKCGDSPPEVCRINEESVGPQFPPWYRIRADGHHSGDELADNSVTSSLTSLDSNEEHHDRCNLIKNRSSSKLAAASSYTYRHFTHQLVKFVWRPAEHRFVELTALDRGTPLADLLTNYHGHSDLHRDVGRQLYGPNEITVEVRSYMSLLFKEVLNPYYVFQVASIALWCADDYYLYASCIFLLSCISVGMALRQTRQESERLHAMVKTNQDATIEVLRPPRYHQPPEPVTVPVTDLVPGDVALFPPDGCLVPCDMVLIAGTAIVNESMLTGESVPVTKTAPSPPSEEIEQEFYDPQRHKRHTLFCGTSVIQTRYYGNAQVRAVVVRTGFCTTKGELVRSIMFPKPMLFSFYQDSMKFIGLLFFISMIGMAYTIYLYIVRGVGIGVMVVRALDLVTIVVPPALPAAMTVGTTFANRRLMNHSIHCISPPRINVAGKVKLVCFDKTGTLTEDSLEVYGVVGVDKQPCNDSSNLGTSGRGDAGQGNTLNMWSSVRSVSSLGHEDQLMVALATCHDLTYVHGRLIGDPMDIKMFQATKWVLEEPGDATYESLLLTVLRPPTCTLVPLPSPAVALPPLSTSEEGELPPVPSPHPFTMIPSPCAPQQAPHSPDGGTTLFVPDLPREAYRFCSVTPQQRATEAVGADGSSYEGGVDGRVGASDRRRSYDDHSERKLGNAADVSSASGNDDLDFSGVSELDDDPGTVGARPGDNEPVGCSVGDSSVNGADTEDVGSLRRPRTSTQVEVISPTSSRQRLTLADQPSTASYPKKRATTTPDEEREPPRPERVVNPVLDDSEGCGPKGRTPPPKNFMETQFQVPYEVGVVRVFEFNSTVQRMSVVARQLTRPYMELYCKGAPEALIGLSNPDTVPSNLSAVLESYTVQGYRVIALGYRKLSQRLTWVTAQKIPREKLENHLTFIGLLVLQNPLKEASEPTVKQLRKANIRTVMATGDNVLTGVSVARQCGLLDRGEKVLLLSVTPPAAGPNPSPPLLTASLTRDPDDSQAGSTAAVRVFSDDPSAPDLSDYHLALSGTTWRLLKQYFPQYVGPVCCRGTVFGRMSPDHKSDLVESLMGLDYVVAMCGDGANDCGALKAAHVGISLSEAEASVAAPFTSSRADVSCVPHLILEGRAALTTNFSVFKYMALYSLIQFLTVLMLYTFHTNLSDPQFLYIDLGIVTSMALFMGYTEASSTLCRQRPCSSLLSSVTLCSVAVQVLCVTAGQVAAYFYLAQQPWFIPNSSDGSSATGGAGDKSWEATVLFLVSSMQYLVMALVYSPGHPFRRPFYTNMYLLVSLIVFGVCSVAMTVYPGPWCSVLLMDSELTATRKLPVQWLFRGTLLMMAAVHLLFALLTEDFFTNNGCLKRVCQCLRRKRQPKNRYKRVLVAMDHDSLFPPVVQPIAAHDLMAPVDVSS